jgi:drug/metabolite transporter (DMT)-like permease
MLIVAGSALLPGERLRWFHLAGVALGFGGAALLLLSGGGWETKGGNAPLGYASAFACALIWSSYSVLAQTQKAAPTDAVAIYCVAAAILSLLCHLVFETTVWPESADQWLAIAGLGLMPVGLAFYAWDYGVKHGNIQLIGSSAYFAPLLSTVILVIAGLATPSPVLAIACLMIVAGALVASGRLVSSRHGNAAE